MFRRRFGWLAHAAVVAFVLAMVSPTVARADPLPADYSGSTHGDVMALNLSAAGLANINAGIGHSATATDSTGDPRAHAESANLDANAVGIPVGVASDQANSDNATPTDSYNTGLGTINVPGALTVGAINGSGSTNWRATPSACPTGPPSRSPRRNSPTPTSA